MANNAASRPPGKGRGGSQNDSGDRIASALVLLGVRAERSHLRWKFIWRSGHGDVAVTALSPPTGRHVVEVKRADDRDVHSHLVAVVAGRVREEVARVELHRALRDLGRASWPERRGGGLR